MSSIFVQIGSYHDSELSATIQDVLEKCSGFHSIHFGIHNCFYEENILNEIDLIKSLDSLEKTYKLSISHSKFPQNVGVGISRYIANEFYKDEDFYMQIDSHMLFTYNWDLIFISSLEKASEDGVEKPLISYALNSYFIDEKKRRFAVEGALNSFSNKNININDYIFKEVPEIRPYGLHQLGEKTEINWVFSSTFNCSIPTIKFESLFNLIYTSGALLFSYGHLSKVKPNKNILYLGDEVLHSSRLYTHGYTVLRLKNPFIVLHLHGILPSQIDPNSQRFSSPGRRSVREDLQNYTNKKQDKNEITENLFNLAYEKSINELKKIIGLRIKDDQSFGSEKDYQKVIDSLFD